jgi:hypothetical protein
VTVGLLLRQDDFVLRGNWVRELLVDSEETFSSSWKQRSKWSSYRKCSIHATPRALKVLSSLDFFTFAHLTQHNQVALGGRHFLDVRASVSFWKLAKRAIIAVVKFGYSTATPCVHVIYCHYQVSNHQLCTILDTCQLWGDVRSWIPVNFGVTYDLGYLSTLGWHKQQIYR